MTTTKKLTAILLAILTVFSMAIPSFATDTEAKEYSYDSTLYFLRKYDSMMYKRMKTEKAATDFEYASENEHIAVVYEDGTVFAKGFGETNITATDKETGEVVYTLRVRSVFNLAYIVNVLTLGLFFSPVDEQYREPWQILAF